MYVQILCIGQFDGLHPVNPKSIKVLTSVAPYVHPVGRFEAAILTLYHSSLDSDAPTYTPVHQVQLKQKQLAI